MCFNSDVDYAAAILETESKRQGLTLGVSSLTPETAAFKYRAFLSYSHADAAWAKWLHRALEGYHIDKDLIGRKTAHGLIPKTLRPVFRDRDDFSAGHSLTDQTVAALEGSQFLIVICSANSARSKYVNEEVLRFKALGRAACVIPVIVDGEPGDPQRECFPPALRFKVDADGMPTGEREDPIAADARPHHDGRELAKQKVVAGLLGISLDEILRRAKRAKRRRNLFYAGAGVAIAMLIAVAAYGWWAENLLDGDLIVAHEINWAHDTADLCENAAGSINDDRIPEKKRVTLVSECVDTFNQLLGELPDGSHVPLRVATSFKRYVAAMKILKTEHKLTSAQLDLLNKAEILLAQLVLP